MVAIIKKNGFLVQLILILVKHDKEGFALKKNQTSCGISPWQFA